MVTQKKKLKEYFITIKFKGGMMKKIIITEQLRNDKFGVLIYGNEAIEIRIVYSNPYYNVFICARDCSMEKNDRLSEIGAELGICKAKPTDPNKSYKMSETMFELDKAKEHFDILEEDDFKILKDVYVVSMKDKPDGTQYTINKVDDDTIFIETDLGCLEIENNKFLITN